MAKDAAARIIPTFKNHPMINESESRKQGRPIFDDVVVCEIRMAADRQNIGVYPANAEAPGGLEDEDTGMTRPCTYAEKYDSQYQQFLKGEAQTKSGTPVEYLPFLSPSKAKELKALDIFTAEALASLDGGPLKRLGQGGREWKNQAQAYLDSAAGSATATALALENEQLREQLENMRKEREQYKAPVAVKANDGSQPTVAGVSQFSDWDDELIKEYIVEKTGAKPKGNPNHKTLVAMADELANA